MAAPWSSSLEAELARGAAKDLEAFAVLADLAEERGECVESCAAMRRLPAVAVAIRSAISFHEQAGCILRQLQVSHYGDWIIFLRHDPRPLDQQDPAQRRGHSPDLEQLLMDFDGCFPAWDAFGSALGFKVVESLRTQDGVVREVRLAHE